jgi:hypothetical protein
MSDESPQPEADAPQPGAEANSNEGPVNEMREAEMRDRFRLAQYSLGRVPPLPLVQTAINMLIAGGGLQGQILGSRLNIVIGNYLAEEAKKAQAKKIIMPGGPAAVPGGLRPKGH